MIKNKKNNEKAGGKNKPLGLIAQFILTKGSNRIYFFYWLELLTCLVRADSQVVK